MKKSEIDRRRESEAIKVTQWKLWIIDKVGESIYHVRIDRIDNDRLVVARPASERM
jgi:hypothetical protein